MVRQDLSPEKILRLYSGQWRNRDRKRSKEMEMDVLWIVNTNTFLLVVLIIMISYLTTQVNVLIRFLKRE